MIHPTARKFAFWQIQDVFPSQTSMPEMYYREHEEESDRVMLTGTPREKGTQTDKFQVSHYQLTLKILSCSCYLEASHASQSYEDINTTSNDSCKCMGNDNNSVKSKERRL